LDQSTEDFQVQLL